MLFLCLNACSLAEKDILTHRRELFCKDMTLEDHGDKIHITIHSDKPNVVLYYYDIFGHEKHLYINQKYYQCITISRHTTPMIFMLDNCITEI